MGTGRNIEFKLTTKADPAALAEIKKFGEAIRAEHDKNTRSAAKAAQNESKERDKAAQSSVSYMAKVRQKSAEIEHAGNLKALQERKKAENDFETWRQRLRANSIQLEYKDNLRAIQENKKARIKAAQDEARELNAIALNNARISAARYGVARGFGQVGRGILEGGRAVAYSGLIGERDTQKVINTLAGVESALSAAGSVGNVLAGAYAISKWMRVLSTIGKIGGVGGGGLAAGGGLLAAGAPVAAGIGALLGTAGAGVAIYDFQRDVRENGLGGGSRYGSFSDRVGSGMAWLAGYGRSTSARQEAEYGRRVGFDERAGAGLVAFNAARSQLLSGRMERNSLYAQGLLGTDTQRELAAVRANAALARGNFAEARGMNARIGASPNFGAQERQEAVRNEVEARKTLMAMLSEQVRLERQAARERVQSARDAVQSAKEELEVRRDIAKSAAEAARQARRDLMSDAVKFAIASPEEQSSIRNIAEKRNKGQALNKEEIEKALEYNEFRDFAESSAVGIAEKLGAGDIFKQGIANRRKAEQDAAAAQRDVVKAELNVKNKLEIVAKVEGQEQSIVQPILRELASLIQQQDQEQRKYTDKAIVELRQEVRQIIVNRGLK